MESNQIQERLIVFTRYPEPGTTKTRLAGLLGDHEAAAVQKKLTEHTMLQARKLMEVYPVTITIYFHGGSREKMQQWLGGDFFYREQGRGDLGQRMAHAFADAFKQKYHRIVIIGTDCPDLKAGHMKEAFASLRRNDLVMGPATDGGYYLIGLSRTESSLFENISWGTETVLAETLKIAAEKGLSTDLLEILSDVDRPEDLKHINNNPDL
jgi:rSAM/selenodomain-associated transferase 1